MNVLEEILLLFVTFQTQIILAKSHLTRDVSVAAHVAHPIILFIVVHLHIMRDVIIRVFF